MRIALGIHRLRPRGGQEDHCIRIAQALLERGHEVTIFSSDDAGDLGIPTVQVMSGGYLRANHVKAARFSAQFVERTKGRFDRTVAFQPTAGVNVVLIGDDVRNRLDTGLLKRLTPRYKTFANLEAACFGPQSNVLIVGFSETQMRAFVERYPESQSRIAILPPTLRRERYRPDLRAADRRATIRRSLGVGNEQKTWLWIGLQPEVKGLDRVLRALVDHPNARLLICGMRADHHKARSVHVQIRKLGLQERVQFLGYLGGEQYSSVLAAADVLAHPARREASGATILEALVNGLPVVATDVCGFAAHVEKSGGGIVVRSPFDQIALNGALAEACGEKEEEYSRRGIAYGADPYLYSGIAAACDLIEGAGLPPRRKAI